MVEVICKECGKIFKISQGRHKKGGAKYCSRKCYSIAFTGIGNPHWKGGVNQDKKKYQKKWFQKYKERSKPRRKLLEFKCRLKRNFGISIEQYNDMLKNQDNKCAICLIDQKDYIRKFGVDHNHTTKKVRGLLCTQCNSILGYSRDSIETLQRAIEYLKRTQV